MQKAFVQVSHPSLCVKGHVVMNLHIVSAEDLEQHGHRPSEGLFAHRSQVLFSPATMSEKAWKRENSLRMDAAGTGQMGSLQHAARLEMECF